MFQNTFLSKEDAVLRLRDFLLLDLLFMIPMLGGVLVVVFSFLPANRNVKNYSRSLLVLEIAFIIFLVIFFYRAYLNWLAAGGTVNG